MKALLAIDLAEDQSDLLRRAAAWAHRLGAQLDLIHVATRPVMFGPGGEQFSDLIEQQWQRTLDLQVEGLERLVGELPADVRGTLHQRVGVPATEIADVARGYDLLLVGTHGRTGMQHLWLGSVAEKVVRISPVPVLVLHPGA